MLLRQRAPGPKREEKPATELAETATAASFFSKVFAPKAAPAPKRFTIFPKSWVLRRHMPFPS